MRFEREIQIEQKETESLGHQIEQKMKDFLEGSFDCITEIQRTKTNGINDRKGIDLVISFENGDKVAVDITAGTGIRIDEKIKSTSRIPLVFISKELNNQGDIEESKASIPRAIISVDMAKWEDYNIERINEEVIVYLSDRIRIREERNILEQLISQIDYFSKDNPDYQNKTNEIKKMLLGELEELEKFEEESL